MGVTACATGIAHTYMAQEKLIEAAKKLNMSVKIETQGRRGNENVLTIDEIKNAKAVILAHDKAITGLDRFNDIQVIDTSTKDAIYNSTDLIKGFKENKKLTTIKSAQGDNEGGQFSLKKFFDFKGNLLAGVSKMLPFVIAGGIILGLGFLIDFAAGNGEAGGNYGTIFPLAAWFSALGKTAMFMIVPILGGYIAYAIVGPQGLMPGIIAGMLADGSGGFAYSTGITQGWANLWGRIFPANLQFTSGFIGALVGGYLAALIVYGLTILMKKMPKSLLGVRDIVFIPVLSLLGIGIIMFVINIPLGYVLYGIKEGLIFLAQHKLLVLVGALIGFMMCVDMGGPINKIAYVLGTMTVAGELPIIVNGVNQSTIIMAASMAGGMVPPLGIALSTILFRNVWTAQERDAAKANWLMGAFFITEGAIPFMITDTKRVVVSGMSGGLITGLLVGAFEIILGAPHGGIFVFPLVKSLLLTSQGAQIGLGIGLYILSIFLGTLTMALILSIWKLIDIKKGKLVINDLEKMKKIKVNLLSK